MSAYTYRLFYLDKSNHRRDVVWDITYSIEKNNEVFELYRVLWNKHGIDGIRVNTMTEGIAKAIEIEKSQTDELYFISIAADDIFTC